MRATSNIKQKDWTDRELLGSRRALRRVNGGLRGFFL